MEFDTRQEQGMSLFSTAYTLPEWPTQPPIQWVLGSSPTVKRPGRKADHSSPYSAEVKDDGAIPTMSSWHCA
jgi:hypothetical protein